MNRFAPELHRIQDRLSHVDLADRNTRNELMQGSFDDILFAQSAEGEICGTILMRHDAASPWLQHAGQRIGTLNTLGVSPAKEGQGIGLALTAGAMEQMHQRGCRICFIQWTGLIDWYGKLGAKPWAHYRMASRTLSVSCDTCPVIEAGLGWRVRRAAR